MQYLPICPNVHLEIHYDNHCIPISRFHDFYLSMLHDSNYQLISFYKYYYFYNGFILNLNLVHFKFYTYYFLSILIKPGSYSNEIS